MSRAAQTFKQGVFAKTVKVLVKEGVKDWRIEITDGKIVVTAGQPETNSAAGENDLDRELAEFEARYG